MEPDSLRTQLRAVMAETFETTIDALPASADTDTVEKWDSLGHLMLIESVEAAFGVAFAHDETLTMLSEDAFVERLGAHLVRQPALSTTL